MYTIISRILDDQRVDHKRVDSQFDSFFRCYNENGDSIFEIFVVIWDDTPSIVEIWDIRNQKWETIDFFNPDSLQQFLKFLQDVRGHDERDPERLT